MLQITIMITVIAVANIWVRFAIIYLPYFAIELNEFHINCAIIESVLSRKKAHTENKK